MPRDRNGWRAHPRTALPDRRRRLGPVRAGWYGAAIAGATISASCLWIAKAARVVHGIAVRARALVRPALFKFVPRAYNCTMRRTLNLIIALCLTLVGAGGVIYLLFFAAGWRGWMVMAAGLLFTAGVVWLYDDFINATPNERT
jgi:hypothetical protein